MSTLLIRGGSIAAGMHKTCSYPYLLSDELARHGIEVVNRSQRGDTSFEAVRTFYDDIDPYRPNILLLHFGVDDMYRPVYRSEFKENLVQVVELHFPAINGAEVPLPELPADGLAPELENRIRQGLGRCDGDRVAGVNTHRVDVLDRADDDAVVATVAHHLENGEVLGCENTALCRHRSSPSLRTER